MLITALLLAAMAPSPAATVATTRAAYTKCLRTDLKTALEAKKAAADYEAALTTVCVTERSAFRAAVIAFDQSSGDSAARSEEHTSELQSLMRSSSAGFCLKKKKKHKEEQ